MQLRYVFSELRTGLRRNLSMHLAVILTIFVSLTLAGCGLMFQRQADKTAEVLGNELQILVSLCVEDDPSDNPNCAGGEVTEAQMQRIEAEIEGSPEVDGYDYQSKEEGYEKAQELYSEEVFEGPDPVITVADWPAGYWVTLKDPNEADGIISAVKGLDGVRGIGDQRDALGQIFGIMTVLKYGSWVASGFLLLAALLLVANTIRLAALARRREIGIMRLVGASTLYIALPFLLEALVTAIVGVGLAAGALALVQEFGVNRGLEESVTFLPWIDWTDYVQTLIGLVPPGIALVGPALTVIPTLLLTRKYIKV
ncbi:cell division transport system permease protein [Nocardioides thalensis]|uniref:Cell division protein FtsX n=1 Tax=Nocardioides thalensis TaxID=1914755 RepID=A0A853BYR0_9ACTN|nr:permease-like cell division protein FtsX [Nocardioides thalensis]NYJ00345.1 cell division transport system permease protein [Nocardioides thalensis]